MRRLGCWTARSGTIGEVLERCRAIVEQVRDEGDRGLIDLTRTIRRRRTDPGDPAGFPCRRSTTPVMLSIRQLREALDYAIENIRKFHETQRPR